MTTSRRVGMVLALGIGALWTLPHAASAQGGDAGPRVVPIDSVLAAYRLPEGIASKSTVIGQMSQQSVSVLQTRTGVRAHYHAQSDEVVYVLSGRGVLRILPEGANISARDLAAVSPQRVKPGMLIFIPRGAAHSIDVLGDDPLVVMSVFSPVFHGEDRLAVHD